MVESVCFLVLVLGREKVVVMTMIVTPMVIVPTMFLSEDMNH